MTTPEQLAAEVRAAHKNLANEQNAHIEAQKKLQEHLERIQEAAQILDNAVIRQREDYGRRKAAGS